MVAGRVKRFDLMSMAQLVGRASSGLLNIGCFDLLLSFAGVFWLVFVGVILLKDLLQDFFHFN
jgi:hypothetical protein